MFLGCCFLAYVLIEHFIVPVCMERTRAGFLDSLLELIMPIFFVNLLMFFGLLEGLCNALVECFLIVDREFYSDWGNCTNYADFNRKWNKIVVKTSTVCQYFGGLWEYKGRNEFVGSPFHLPSPAFVAPRRWGLEEQ